jgi:hypothetical protein
MGGSLRVSLWLMGKELTLRLWFIKTQWATLWILKALSQELFDMILDRHIWEVGR